MLAENIRTIRKSKGFSQQELAVQMNVVRQTVSKWERGISVPDSDLLLLLSEILETPVSTLLGEKVPENEANDLKKISQKLEVINFQLAKRKEAKVKYVQRSLFLLASITIIIFVVITTMGSNYLEWDYNDPEAAVVGTIWHGFEWVFVRAAPLILIALILGIILIRTNCNGK